MGSLALTLILAFLGQPSVKHEPPMGPPNPAILVRNEELSRAAEFFRLGGSPLAMR